MKIELKDEKFQLEKAGFFEKANIDANCDDAPMKKSEVHAVLSSMYDHIYSVLNSMYEYSMRRDSSIVNQVNNCLESHCEGHLPPMHPGQVQSVLKAAGIDGDFVAPKTPVTANTPYIYASVDGEKLTLKGIKVDLK